MIIVHFKVLLISCIRVVAMRHIEDILFYVLLYHKPRSAAETHTLTLSYRMEPQPLMLSDALTRFQLYHITRLFTQIATDIVVIIHFPQETDALRVLTTGIHQMFAFCYLTYFILHIVTYREECLLQLPVIDLGKKVRLILHGVRTGAKPFPALVVNLRLSIMTCGNKTIIMSAFFIKSTKLYQTIAHHIRIGRQARTYLIHRIFRHLIPIFTMAVNHLKPATILMCHSRSHLKILL